MTLLKRLRRMVEPAPEKTVLAYPKVSFVLRVENGKRVTAWKNEAAEVTEKEFKRFSHKFMTPEDSQKWNDRIELVHQRKQARERVF